MLKVKTMQGKRTRKKKCTKKKEIETSCIHLQKNPAQAMGKWGEGGTYAGCKSPSPHDHFSNGPSLMLIHVNKIHSNVAIQNKKHFLKLLRMLSLCFFFAFPFVSCNIFLAIFFDRTKIQSFLLDVSSEEVLWGNQSCFLPIL